MRYKIAVTTVFKKELKVIKKRRKDLLKLKKVVDILSNGGQLEEKYRDHQLINNTRFKNCRECHIEPDWLLVYRYENEELVLVLVETGTHSDLF